jgi:hypothetical protein
MGGVDVTYDDNIVVQSDDDSVMSDDQYSNAEHGNRANGEEVAVDVDEADKEEEEEQKEKIENNGEVDEMPALRRSERVSKPVCQWWMVDMQNPVNYVLNVTLNVTDNPEDEYICKAATTTNSMNSIILLYYRLYLHNPTILYQMSTQYLFSLIGETAYIPINLLVYPFQRSGAPDN